MFITVHHVSELWIRLFLHELELVRSCVVRDDLDPSFKALQRIGKVQTQLFGVWEVLATMTPSDYTSFRNLLGRSSGFQSAQYRLLEFGLAGVSSHDGGVHVVDDGGHGEESLCHGGAFCAGESARGSREGKPLQA